MFQHWYTYGYCGKSNTANGSSTEEKLNVTGQIILVQVSVIDKTSLYCRWS